MNTKDIATLIEEMGDMREIAEVIDTTVRAAAPVLRAAIEDLSDFSAELTVRQVNKLVSLGFTRDEAILLTINARETIAEYVRRATSGRSA